MAYFHDKIIENIKPNAKLGNTTAGLYKSIIGLIKVDGLNSKLDRVLIF